MDTLSVFAEGAMATAKDIALQACADAFHDALEGLIRTYGLSILDADTPKKKDKVLKALEDGVAHQKEVYDAAVEVMKTL
jgi:hypothetical protein